VGVITIGISRLFISTPPHPAPLPRGEREFPDENKLRMLRKEVVDAQRSKLIGRAKSPIEGA